MIGMKVKPKKWGNSVAVIIPESIVKQAGIRPGKPLELLISEKSDLSLLWGKLKTKKSAKQLREEAGRGWN